MTNKERGHLKEKIIETIAKVEADILQLEDATKPISPENAIGRISRMDAINNKSVSEASLRASKRKLTKLKMALGKIEAPDFGVCARCKRPIPPARLMFMPESTYCVRCAELKC